MTLLLNAVAAPCITAGHRLAVNTQHLGRRLIGRSCRVEVALLHRVAITVVTVLFDLLLALAIGGVRHHVVRVGLLLPGLLRRVDRFDVLRRFGDDVFLGALLVGVVSASGQEEHRAAQPDLLCVIRQGAHANPAWWFYDNVAWALRAIPVAARIEVIVATVRHA